MWLDRNQLRGTLPAVWGLPIGDGGGAGLTGISYLDLESNELTGTLPSERDRLTNLNEVKLSSNHLTGSIPASWGTRLINVHRFGLDGWNLTGSIGRVLSL